MLPGIGLPLLFPRRSLQTLPSGSRHGQGQCYDPRHPYMPQAAASAHLEAHRRGRRRRDPGRRRPPAGRGGRRRARAGAVAATGLAPPRALLRPRAVPRGRRARVRVASRHPGPGPRAGSPRRGDGIRLRGDGREPGPPAGPRCRAPARRGGRGGGVHRRGDAGGEEAARRRLCGTAWECAPAPRRAARGFPRRSHPVFGRAPRRARVPCAAGSSGPGHPVRAGRRFGPRLVGAASVAPRPHRPGGRDRGSGGGDGRAPGPRRDRAGAASLAPRPRRPRET